VSNAKDVSTSSKAFSMSPSSDSSSPFMPVFLFFPFPFGCDRVSLPLLSLHGFVDPHEGCFSNHRESCACLFFPLPFSLRSRPLCVPPHFSLHRLPKLSDALETKLFSFVLPNVPEGDCLKRLPEGNFFTRPSLLPPSTFHGFFSIHFSGLVPHTQPSPE